MNIKRLSVLLAAVFVHSITYAAPVTAPVVGSVKGAAKPLSDQGLVKHYSMVPAQLSRYQPTAFADRIILLPTAMPATSQTVNWRTNNGVGTVGEDGGQAVRAEIALSQSGPGFALNSQTVTGRSQLVQSENGQAYAHSVTFSALQPDTLYSYRVQGAGTWSEWLQFRTAASEFAPFSLIYFGDAQNHNKSHVSRVMREALLARPRAKMMLHAGDLISQRDGNHDNEWGEWFDALGWQGAMVNQFITPGNHEYSDDDTGPLVLSPQFAGQFAALRNGPAGLEDTVYFTQYQGVLLISLNSTAAVENEAAARVQAKWLEQVLSAAKQQAKPPRWTLVTFHHPMFSVSEGRDNARLRSYWQEILEKYQVDLVLQGHDHTYGRQSSKAVNGPVYLVSVAGPKMYLSSKQASANMQRLAEDTQLFQLIDFDTTSLRYEARTATGELYDAFVLQKDHNGQKQLETSAALPATRLCQTPAAQRLKATRCWNGTEFNLPQPSFGR